MRHQFLNTRPEVIDPNVPNTVHSRIEVSRVRGAIRDVNVLIDIQHTFDSDLEISLIAPNETKVLLVGREGGSRNNFQLTVFDDEARRDVQGAGAPFRGVFRPEGSLSDFDGTEPNGIWTLEITDRAFADGGRLRAWALEIEAAIPEPRSEYNVDVNILGGLNPGQQDAFRVAAERWQEIIVGDLPDIRLNGNDVVDDVRIDAEGTEIDGAGRILGRAGPSLVRTDGGLPITGVMSFDVADLGNMERNGSLVNVIVHEMGHVLGLGTLWDRMGLMLGAGTANPVFVGPNAMREYGELIDRGPMPVPISNTGGPGTRDGHWRESVFGNELMTGFLDGGINPVSRVTIAALEDMGYRVNFDVADDYRLPTDRELRNLGIRGGLAHCDHCSALLGYAIHGNSSGV